MKRPLLTIAKAFLLLNLLVGLGCSRETPKGKDPRPNIILIVADDLDTASLKYMPKVSSLLTERGVTFTNCFVSSPYCAPSRASMLLGQYAHTHGGTQGAKQFRQRGLEQETIGTVMQAAGYRTALIGKYINGYTYPLDVPPGWDDWRALMVEQKSYYYNGDLNENGKRVHYGEEQKDYMTSVLYRKAVEFIEREKGERPFFMYLAPTAPHTPCTPAEEYKERFKDVAVTFTFEADISDKPAWVRDYRKTDPNIFKHFSTTSEEWYRKRWRTLLSLDDMVEGIVEKLKEAGEFDNTVIIFTSDNGDGLTKHIPVSAKLSPYEEGIKVPLIIAGPGMAKNAVRDHLVSNVDFLPTAAELAGAKAPASVDGRSLLSLLGNGPVPYGQWREAVAVENVRVPDSWPWKSHPPMYRLVRTSGYKYVEYETGEREYYDLIKDPDEMENIYGSLGEARKLELAAQAEKVSGWPVWGPDEARPVISNSPSKGPK